jgi:hypothetical protein
MNKYGKINKSIIMRKSNKFNRTRKTGIVQNFQKENVIILLSFLNTLKLYHWKTHSYATHKATDELYGKFSSNMDRFVEVLLGKIGNRINLQKINNIPIRNINSTREMNIEIQRFKSYLISLDNNKFMKLMSNADLYTIRDEIMADLNQFLYLLTFP